MDSFLTSDAWKELSGDYGLATGEVSAPSIKSLALSELLKEGTCRAYMEWLMEHIGSPNVSVASSMLVKRVASLLVAPVLSAMTYYNRGIGIELEHCRLFHPDASAVGTAFPFMSLSDARVTTPETGNREEWRAVVVRQLFAERLTPLMKTIATAGSLSMAILWENVMARIVPVYVANENQDGELGQRIQDDFLFMTKGCSGELFGMRKNPLGSLTELDESLRVTGRTRRLTCCLYYQMAPEYCLKCPKP
ncbi:IucA/IucC family C-terminal-domain containing protein [Paenibacillaceae bacterium WGS1546]|uniref:IucA/IucC family C-terminal-domain containing protein n=1 Tax=Cohnella sp. WGS1546 TaxID=3366810 RepID=UPI00372D4009